MGSLENSLAMMVKRVMSSPKSVRDPNNLLKRASPVSAGLLQTPSLPSSHFFILHHVEKNISRPLGVNAVAMDGFSPLYVS